MSLEIDRINRPPLSDEKVGVGYISEQRYIKVGETNAFNYPQGARMQWFSKTNKFTVNIQNGNHWGAALYDTDVNKLVDKFDSTIHVLTNDGRFGFGLDYHRLHCLGGYGYIGLPDPYSHENAPSMQGIWIIDTLTKEKKLLRNESLCCISLVPTKSCYLELSVCWTNNLIEAWKDNIQRELTVMFYLKYLMT